jgi:hypothetical protein
MTTKTEIQQNILDAYTLLTDLKEENRMAVEDQQAIGQARDLLAQLLEQDTK